jgi:ankyrin repeat protein
MSYNPSSDAAVNGDVPKLDASVNMQDEFSRTPLYVVALVAVNDHFDVVQYLVEIDANENMNSESLGPSPLTAASEEGLYDIVQLLVQNGADIHVCHTCNMMPLYLASKPAICNGDVPYLELSK